MDFVRKEVKHMRKFDFTEYLMELCMITLGIAGTMGCFLQSFPLPASMLICMLGIALVGIIVYIAYRSTYKKQIMIAVFIIYILIAGLNLEACYQGILYCLNVILRIYESNSQFTFQTFQTTLTASSAPFATLMALWVVFIPVVILIIRTVRCKHSYFLAFFVSVPFLFFILLFTLRPHPVFFTMLMMFYLMLLGMSFASHHNTYQTSSAILKCGVCLGLCGLLLMSAMRFFSPEESYIRSASVESIRANIQLKVRNIIQGIEESDTGELDLSTANNRYYINVNELQVEMEEPQAMYLHAFSASVYDNQRWTQPLAADFDKLYNWKQDGLIHPFEFIRVAAQESHMRDEPQAVKITNIQADPDYVYMPYGINDQLNDILVQDAYMTSEERKAEIEFHIWTLDQQAQMKQLSAVNQYIQKIKALNLTVPSSLKSTLNAVPIDISSSMSNEERISVIQEYMRGFGSYTLSPGSTPEGKDFIEYFLKENKQGYCVHYASAAVMLLRYYGVPARYASGYRVGLNAFNNGVANVLDSDAHAWVEVLDDQAGWVPLEVTPSASANQDESVDQITSAYQPNPQPTNPNQTQTAPNNRPNTTTQTQTKEESGNGVLSRSLLIVLVITSLLLLCAIGVLVRRKKRLIKWHQRLHQKHSRKAILACNAYLKAADITEKDLSEEIKQIMEEAKFSTHPMDQRQRDLVVSYCERMVLERVRKASRKQKLIYRLIKCIN